MKLMFTFTIIQPVTFHIFELSFCVSIDAFVFVCMCVLLEGGGGVVERVGGETVFIMLS